MTNKSEIQQRLPTKLQIGKHILYPQRELLISDNLSMELRRQPGLFAWYGRLYSLAYRNWQGAKQDVLERQEDLLDELRERNAERHGKDRMIVTELKAKVNRDPKLRLLWRRQTKMNSTRHWMFVLVQAADQRGRLLQTLGANRRKEVSQPDSVRSIPGSYGDDE